MAKNVLKYDNELFGFILVGIVSSFRDFQVCREINNFLELSLERCDDYMIQDNKRNAEVGFAFFSYLNEDEDQYFLISNKTEGGLLIPEQKQLDFFLLIKPGKSPIDGNETARSLKAITLLQAVFVLDVNKLKSKENLLF